MASLYDSVINISVWFFDRYQWAGSVSYMYVDVYPPTATVYTVTGLKPSTTYNFSVNALNVIGESGYADNNKILSVTTSGKKNGCILTDGFLIYVYEKYFGLQSNVGTKPVTYH